MALSKALARRIDEINSMIVFQRPFTDQATIRPLLSLLNDIARDSYNEEQQDVIDHFDLIELN